MKNFSEVYQAERQKVLIERKNKQIQEYKDVKKALMEAFKTSDPNLLPLEARKSFITTLNECYKKDKGLTPKGRKFLDTHVISLNENSTKEQKINYLKRRLNEEVELNLVASGIKESIKSIIDEMYKGIKTSNISNVLPTNVISDIIRYTLLSQLELYMANVYAELNKDVPEESLSGDEENIDVPEESLLGKEENVSSEDDSKYEDEEENGDDMENDINDNFPEENEE